MEMKRFILREQSTDFSGIFKWDLMNAHGQKPINNDKHAPPPVFIIRVKKGTYIFAKKVYISHNGKAVRYEGKKAGLKKTKHTETNALNDVGVRSSSIASHRDREKERENQRGQQIDARWLPLVILRPIYPRSQCVEK